MPSGALLHCVMQSMATLVKTDPCKHAYTRLQHAVLHQCLRRILGDSRDEAVPDVSGRKLYADNACLHGSACTPLLATTHDHPPWPKPLCQA